ncbi:MAG: hypothetical protein ACRBBK_10410 [Paracoccaceae bacterium]
MNERDKSARLVDAYVNDKPERTVRLGADPHSIFQMPVIIKCEDPDVEGAWSWGVDRQWCHDEWAEKVEPKFSDWQNLTWAEIDSHTSDTQHRMHHNMNCEAICEEAQYRMIEIEKFFDTLFRFRAGNRERIWGYRITNTFYVLWYDPTHQIYPTG